jgi:NADH-quinone oxidoreductase subunit J
MIGEWIVFTVLAGLALLTAAVVVLPVFRNAVVCALALALNLVSVAGLFFLLDAQFIGFLQVIVYAGAIMVLILFVLMLLNVHDERHLGGSGFMQRSLGPLLTLGCAALLGSVALSAAAGRAAFPASPSGYGTVRALGLDLFARFFYPFEVISLLLIVAMIGAVLLAKRRL